MALAARRKHLKIASYLHVRAIPVRIRTEAAPLALIAEKNAKGTANIVLKTRRSIEDFGLPSAHSREGRGALIVLLQRQLTTIKL